jgi:hypothetical protein
MPFVEVSIHTGERETIADARQRMAHRGISGPSLAEALRALEARGSCEAGHYWYRRPWWGESEHVVYRDERGLEVGRADRG